MTNRQFFILVVEIFIYFFIIFSALIYYNLNQEKELIVEVVFEFYLISYSPFLDSLAKSKLDEPHEHDQSRLSMGSKSESKKADMSNQSEQSQTFVEQTLQMDLDFVWISALRLLQLFEEAVHYTCPSLIFDRFSLCPECEKFSFIGEWLTPKGSISSEFQLSFLIVFFNYFI